MSTPTRSRTFAQLYAEVQQFYARHMQMLDDGDAAAWAQTFTEDCSFLVPTLDAPLRGRDALRSGAARAVRDLASAGEVHRHWHGMTAVEPRPDGSVEVRCYALVIATPRGGDPRIHRACVCADVLVPDGDGWLVARRHVTRDDRP